jgi:arabinogalactan oligomer / maltooligosaccharide transport system permease protein
MATSVQPVAQRTARKSQLGREFAKNRAAYLYILPALMVMGIVTFYPLFYQLWMSLTDYGIRSLNPNSPTYVAPNFVGLDNYLRILGVRGNLALPNFNFLRMLGFNLWWTFSNVIIHVSLGILIAVILNQPGVKGRAIYRAIYVLPMVIPALVIATVWRNMFDPQYGPINQMLASIGGLFGIPASTFVIRWMEQVSPPIPGVPLPLSYFAMLITNIWLGWPFMTIVATGALQSIPRDIYEAAEIDGASRVQQFWTLTLPLLRPAMVPAAMYGIITTFNLFHIIYFMSAGGPLRQTEILVTQAYRLVNEQRLYGVAAAFSVYIFFILLGLTLLTNRVTRATESYDA